MKTIKGYLFNTGKGYTYQRTPAARLKLFRELGVVRCGQNWRSVRANMSAPEASPLSPGFNVRYPDTRTPVMYSFDSAGMRERWADDVDGSGVNHNGWFSDADCSSTLRGFVVRLSHGRFGAGYADSDTGEHVYYLKVFDDERDAARFADSEAQHYAESEKEYSERWQEAHKLRDDIEDHKRDLRAAFKCRNDKHFDYRANVAELVDSIRTARERLATEFKDI